MKMTPEYEAKIDEMLEKVSAAYHKFRDEVGTIAVEYDENPYHVFLSTLLGGVEQTKRLLAKADKTAVACMEKIQRMSEETGLPEELLMAMLEHNPEMLKDFVINTHKGLD